MTKINLETLSADDLWSLHEQISRILAVRLASEKRQLDQRLATLRGRQFGDGIETGAAKKARRPYPRVQPKYRNPNSLETWSGRGKQPRWLVAALKSGKKVDDFRIDQSARSKGRGRSSALRSA